MKTLNDYIINTEICEDILNRLYVHICVEFKLEHNAYPYIVESLGKFDNAGLVVKHIIDTLKNNFESQTIDCSKFNVFFFFFYVKIDESAKGLCSYCGLKNDVLNIKIMGDENVFTKNIDTYIKLIVHELVHAYEDYNRKKNTGKGIFDFLNAKYTNSFNNVNSPNEVKMWLGRCNYFLNDHERNAYLSQLESDIESIFKNDHITIEEFNYTKFKDKLKETSIWKEYFKISAFILKLCNTDWNDVQKQYVEDMWNDLYNEKRTFNQIKKELYNNWQKFEKKFEQLVPKIICRYIDTNLKEVAIDASVLTEENYWKNLL